MSVSINIWLRWSLIAACKTFSCGRHTLSCSLGDLIPDQGSNRSPLHWEHGVLVTRPPRKSLGHFVVFWFFFFTKFSITVVMAFILVKVKILFRFAKTGAKVCVQLLSRVRLCDPVDCRLLCPWNFPGKNTVVGCHFLLHWIFPTWGSNLRLLAGTFLTTAPPSGRTWTFRTGVPKALLQSSGGSSIFRPHTSFTV